ncbi:MAG: cupin domain-containing protein, partial [Planctomycetes bacterium]|nr:cupin domain-containing protein [Planctomycetota bacterium]
MTEPSPATIRRPTEGRTIGIVGDIYRFLVTGEETDGRYAMFEATVLPGGGPPLHLHRREDETF